MNVDFSIRAIYTYNRQNGLNTRNLALTLALRQAILMHHECCQRLFHFARVGSYVTHNKPKPRGCSVKQLKARQAQAPTSANDIVPSAPIVSAIRKALSFLHKLYTGPKLEWKCPNCKLITWRSLLSIRATYLKEVNFDLYPLHPLSECGEGQGRCRLATS